MPRRVLYQRLCQHLAACAPHLRVWPRRRLALLVTGLLLARHTALPRLSAQLRGVVPRAQADSLERRLRRTLVETDFESARVFEHVVGASLRTLPAGRCLLLLDDTQQTTRCILSTLALAYAGRALPLAWCRWSGKLNGAYWRQIDGLFDQAARLLPSHVQPVVVADRGIASPMLIRLIQQHGWDYLVRVTNDATMHLPEQPRQVVRLGQLVAAPGAAPVMLSGWIFRRNQVWGHALAVWRRGHQEPWLLISNLAHGERLAELYARRMHVEALFRDVKSGGFEWELSRVLHAEPAKRLLVGLMLALWCAVLLGEASMRAGEIPAYARRAHAVSLVRRGLDWLAAPGRSRYFRWTLAPPKTVRI
jgi:Transposase DDE domain